MRASRLVVVLLLIGRQSDQSILSQSTSTVTTSVSVL